MTTRGSCRGVGFPPCTGSHPTGEAYVPFLAHSNALSLHRHLVAASGLFPLALTGPAPREICPPLWVLPPS